MPNSSANIDFLETYLVSIERSSKGLLGTIETVEIVEELMEIGPNEVCDIPKFKINDQLAVGD